MLILEKLRATSRARCAFDKQINQCNPYTYFSESPALRYEPAWAGWFAGPCS
jgi:hypothetical protein